MFFLLFYLAAIELMLLPRTVSCDNTDDTQGATAFALTYGYPSLIFEGHVKKFRSIGVNILQNDRITCTADLCPTTVRPDVDTVYSQMVWDLSHDDVILRYPEGIPDDQFVLFSFFE